MKRAALLAALVSTGLGIWLATRNDAHAVADGSVLRGDTIVASDLADVDVERLANRRVWIQGDLVRLGREEIDEDFAVADATGIAPLDLDPTLMDDPALLDAMMHGHQVEVAGVVEIDQNHESDLEGPRIAVSRAEDILLRPAPRYDVLAQALAALALALLIAYLVSRQRNAERRTAEIAAFTEELKRREEILEAVGYSAEQFLRNESWEATVPAVLERLGRAAGVTRANVYGVSTRDGGADTVSLGEWVAPEVAQELGESAPPSRVETP